MTSVQTSDQVNEIFTALAKAQAEMENVAKDRENPHFRSRYATLSGVLDEVRGKLAKHGISIWQAPVNGDGSNVGIVTRLGHASGQWIESALYVQPTKFDAQGVGSVLTYLRRYSLMAVAGVGPEDDDGNAAVGKPEGRPQPRPQPAAPAERGAAATSTAQSRGPYSNGNGNGVNGHALPPNPEKPPEVNAERERIRKLIQRGQNILATAPDDHKLDTAWDDYRDSLAEIERAGPAGVEAANALRARYNLKIAELRSGK